MKEVLDSKIISQIPMERLGKREAAAAMNQQLYRIPESFANSALIKQSDYRRMYADSVEDPERFWASVGRRIDWIKPFSRVKDSSYHQSDVHIRWFYDGTLNVASNCLDRHLPKHGDKTAIIWEPDDPNHSQSISYRQAHGTASVAEPCPNYPHPRRSGGLGTRRILWRQY